MKATVLTMLAALTALAACDTGGLNRSAGGVYAPGVSRADNGVNNLEVGHRLMDAGQFELALEAYTRAAGDQGLNVDTLSALGSANLRLGRLGQAETLMRRAVDADPTFAPALNNLGVILMERGETAEAVQIFRRAFATDNGNSDQIRDNLRLALARLEETSYANAQEAETVQLVRAGDSEYQILTAP